MIIGLAGYISSGKDTVAKMIQYWSIVRDDTNPLPFNPNLGFGGSPWQVKKFAGKLKQMVSLLTGIPVADLEKEEVKSSKLPEEWDRWMIPSKLTQQFEVIHTNDIESWKRRFKHLGDPVLMPITVRQLLQELGTNAMRDVVHSNIHVNALFADYKPINDKYHSKGEWREDKTGIMMEWHEQPIYPNWVISDVRFPNEAQAIKDRGGIVIRVHRYNSQDGSDYGWGVERHSSETSLDNWKFDAIIKNGGTLEDLLNSTKEVLKQFNILT